MRCPVPAGMMPGLLAAVVALCVMLLIPPVIHSQRAQSPLEIGGMRHTLVDDRSIIVVILTNSGSDTLDATGEFTMVDPIGSEVARVPVATGPIAPGAMSALAVPIDVQLPPGLYTATLTLEDRSLDVRATSGLREIVVDPEIARPTPTMPASGTVVQLDDEPDRGGFPAWILLIIGLGMSVLGVTYMRSSSAGGRKPAPPRVPEVSMVRKVKVSTPPPKRPATIKPLLPPRRRDRG